MTVIYTTEHNTKYYVVTFENNGCIKVQKIEDISNDENTILIIKPIEKFLGKSQACDMTAMSGAFDRTVFDGSSIFLKISKKNRYKYRYVYVGGNVVCSFLTNHKVYEYISNMGNNLTLYSIAVGDEYIFFLTPHFKFGKREKIDYDDLLSRNEKSVDPYDCHLSKCGKVFFKKIGIL